MRRVGLMTAIGVVGGVVGYVLSRLVDQGTIESDSQLRVSSGFWFMMIMVGIGGALVVGVRLVDGQPVSGRAIAIAAPSLLIGGFVSGFVGQMIYSAMLDSDKVFNCQDEWCLAAAARPARTIGWGIAGLLGGLAVGVSFLTTKRIQNGLLGGLAGGVLGGLMFDLVAAAFGVESDVVPQLVAITLVGVLVALAIGLLDTARTAMWLDILNGEFRGRQMIVLENRTTVGSSNEAQLRIQADRAIAPVHLVVMQQGAAASFVCTQGQSVYLNGQPATNGHLAGGDILQLGSTQLLVGRRKSPPSQPVSGQGVSTSHTVAGMDFGQSGPVSRRPTASAAAGSAPSGPVSLPPVQHQVRPSAPVPGSAQTGAPRQRPRLPTKPKN